MNGMEMMLKSFGIDIEAIKAEMQSTIEKIVGGIKFLSDKQEETRQRTERIEAKVDHMMRELRVRPMDIPPAMIEHKANGVDANA